MFSIAWWFNFERPLGIWQFPEYYGRPHRFANRSQGVFENCTNVQSYLVKLKILIHFKVCLLLNASLCQILSNDHDPIYNMIAKRNSYHISALYGKRDRSSNDNDHALDLTKAWLRRAKSSQTSLKSRNPLDFRL